MRTQHDLNRALNDLKRDADDPLMSRESVIALLAANPVSSSSSSSAAPAQLQRRTSRMPWLVGGSLALATAVALVVVNTSDDEAAATNDVAATTSAPAKETVQSEAVASTSDVAVSTPNEGISRSTTDGAATTARTESVPPEALGALTQEPAPSLAIATIRLAATQLAAFGLQYVRGSITYIEDATRVTIRANGVATTLDAPTKDVASKLDAVAEDVATLTPIMVVVYHDEAHYASWYDRTNPELVEVQNTRNRQIKMQEVSAINGLIAIRVPLEAANVLARKVDVVLWFPGTQAVAERLPDQYRRQLLAELGIAQQTTTTQYTQPDLGGSSLIASSLVFPNPLRSGMATIRLQMKRSAVCTGIITDMFGKEIATAWQSQSVSEGQTDLPLLGLDNAPTGVYNVLVTFEGSQERIVQRLMIQR